MHPSQNQQHLVYEEYYSTQDIEAPSMIPIQYSQQQQQTRYVSVPHLVQSHQPSSVPSQHIVSQQSQSSNNQIATTQSQQPSNSAEPIDLECEENLGRCKSPDEFPEYVPGAWDEVRQHKSIAPGKSAMRFRTELDSGDVKLVNELGQLTVDNLLDYMKNLQNNAFLLGEEEAKEFQRAKCLGIFQK
uniref:Uncharacterized protein n=1 Tax=Panagrolaimus superbus TaxID=310955 RepID=A0A914YZI4_9BILA